MLERKTLDSDKKKSRLRSDVTWLCWYACIFQMDGCDHTMSYHMWSFSLLDGCNHTLFSLWSSLTDGCTHTWIHLHDHSLDGYVHATIHVSFYRVLSYVYVSILSCRFFNGRLWFLALIHKAFHPTLVWPSRFRGHLLHNIFSLSLYSLFLDPGGPLEWTPHAFYS